jgi:trehalose 6-phosphate phosphatase
MIETVQQVLYRNNGEIRMLAQEIQNVLRQKPLGLVFDIDGTLSPIASTPGGAHLHPQAAELLEQAKKYAHVAIVTGRGLQDGARMVGVDNITYVGNHGLEWSNGLPETHEVTLVAEARPYEQAGKEVLDLAEQELKPIIPELIVQRKSVGGTLHYRLAPDPEQARERILSVISEPAQRANMRVGEGKRVVEILPPITVNKGTALQMLVQRFQLRGIVFAGDDRTDLNGVLALEGLRETGLAAWTIAVRHTDTPVQLLEHADSSVNEVEGMIGFFKEMIEFLEQTVEEKG